MADRPVMLITGASRGIGAYLASWYGKHGYTVIGCSRKRVVEEPTYSHLCVDVTVEEQVVELLRRIRTDHGRLDVVINNAGVNTALSLTTLTSFAAAQTTMNTNFMGTFLICREAAKVMMRRKYGRFINMGSMATKHEVAGEGVYTASKAAVVAFTRVIAKEFFSSGITCNVVSPSAITSELMAQVDTKALEEVLRRNAIPKVGTFEDVTNAIDFLIRPESEGITGQVIYLGGA